MRVEQAFQPFESAEQALANMNMVSEHMVSDELKNFLELQLPAVKSSKKGKKAKGFSLGVIDHNFASAIQVCAPVSPACGVVWCVVSTTTTTSC